MIDTTKRDEIKDNSIEIGIKDYKKKDDIIETILFNKKIIIKISPIYISIYSINVLFFFLSIIFYLLSLQSLNLLKLNSKLYFNNWIKKIGIYLLFSSLFLSLIYQMIIQNLINNIFGKIIILIYIILFIFQKGNTYYDHGLYNFFGLIFFTFFFFVLYIIH